MFENTIFWKDTFDGEKAQGGIFYRAVDLKKFMELVELILQYSVFLITKIIGLKQKLYLATKRLLYFTDQLIILKRILDM